ncbi:MAG: methyltransferase domain-containing protein [Planctomycetota bacterium]
MDDLSPSAPGTNASMSEPSTSRLYDLWAGVYDHTFGRLVHKRQHRALQQVQHRSGDRVLDLGVGTGMTLEHYPRDLRVVGVDLSPGMLAKAAEKTRSQNLTHVQLCLANALETPFADHSFDHVVISHTISVVSEPNKLLREAKRLVKPDGRIIVLNHFRSSKPVVGWAERVFNPLFVKIGWRSDLELEECLDGVGLGVLYHFKMSVIDFWQIVVLTPRPRSLARPA